jgi:hypothetical protein
MVVCDWIERIPVDACGIHAGKSGARISSLRLRLAEGSIFTLKAVVAVAHRMCRNRMLAAVSPGIGVLIQSIWHARLCA